MVNVESPAHGCAGDCAGGDARARRRMLGGRGLADGRHGYGVATRPGSFGFFAAAWVTMMAAMMLPSAAPAVARHARVSRKVRAAPPFAGSYLAIWALAGVVASRHQ